MSVNDGEVSHTVNGRPVARRAQSQLPRTALILYGSETGNAQDVAEEVGRLAERLRFDTTVLDMDSVQLRDMLKYTVVIIAISTTGQGEMPQNARTLWRTLLSGALKPGVLRRIRFTSFGLGDSSYPRYNVSHRILCGRLVQLGAQLFCERGEGNEQHPEGHSAGFRQWIVSLKSGLIETFPLPEGVDPVPDEEFLEPRWKLARKADGKSGLGEKIEEEVDASLDKQTETSLPDVPSTDLLPVQGCYTARLVANERLTATDHFQDVRLLDLRLGRNYDYSPGAVAVIYPKNFPEDVAAFIELMRWQHVADEPLQLVHTGSASSQNGLSTPSPLRQLDLSNTAVTIRWLLENVFDIMSIPRRTFFANLAYFAGQATEDEQYQKERLLELANPELIDELWDYTTRPKRTMLEVMMDFTTIQIPWQYALSALPIMRGRQFSIASGGALKQDEHGKTRVQLLIAIADPPSPIIKWRRRYGICTRYITSLQAGQTINIGMQQGYLDVRPDEVEKPVMLVGPGTGLAPMRAMIYQRIAWRLDGNVKSAGKCLEGDVLFFGCRAEEADYFFRDEWVDFAAKQGLQVFTAFSRDKQHPKQYVQDLIRANKETVYRLIHELEGRLYICGSSGNMPKGVREALLDVLNDQNVNMSREDAETYLDSMEKSGRYKQETW